MKNGLFLVGPKNPAASIEEFKNDTYILLAKHLIEKGLIEKAFFYYNQNKSIKSTNIETYPGISIRFLNTKANFSSMYKKEYQMTLVRGNWLEHLPIMKKVKSKLNYFYAADPVYLPAKKMMPFIDIIFTDEKLQKARVKKKYKKKAIVFDKIINTKIFKPKKGAKTYDLSYVANFRQWKNHNLLFSAISKYQDKYKKEEKYYKNKPDKKRKKSKSRSRSQNRNRS